MAIDDRQSLVTDHETLKTGVRKTSTTNYTRRGSQNASPPRAGGSLVSDQFMQLLMAQLRNQNPLGPDKDLMADRS
jgi:flagellar hook assembly protein FlgD